MAEATAETGQTSEGAPAPASGSDANPPAPDSGNAVSDLTAELERSRAANDQLVSVLERLGSRQEPAPPPPTPPTFLRPEDYEKAAEEGRLGTVVASEIAKAREVSRAEALSDFRREFEPFKRDVLSTAATLTEHQAMSALPDYKRFKGEIEKRLAPYGAEMAANPQARQMIYNQIRGEKADDLIREAEERTLRRVRDGEVDGLGASNRTPTGSQGTGQAPMGPKELAAAGHLSPQLVDEVYRIGGGRDQRALDTFARQMGRGDWADWCAARGIDVTAGATR